MSSERVTPVDASLLGAEEANTPMHVASVIVLDAEALTYEQLVVLVAARLHMVPRYRQRLQPMPLGLLPAQWVDDPHFDLSYHVRQTALPRPGSRTQLEEFVGRVIARRLDRSKPLWEMYFVEGLEGDQVALVVKSHMALVDGGSGRATDLVQALLTDVPESAQQAEVEQGSSAIPSPIRLAAGAAVDALTIPWRLVTEPLQTLQDARHVAERVVAVTGEAASAAAHVLARPAPRSPLNVEVGAYRRYAMVAADLEDFRRIRACFAKRRADRDVTVNDVALATITGALRGWMLARGQSAATGVQVRALVPLSIYDRDAEGVEAPTAGVDRVEACFIDLPVGEPRPTMRLHQIAYGMRQQVRGQPAVDARSLAGLAGFAPSRLHSLAARLGSLMARRMFNLVVTNVPGPQQEMFVVDAPVVATYPAVPLAHGQALTIGLTSYNGQVFFGMVADRDAMPDLDLLAQCIPEAIDELLEVLKVR